MSAVLAHYAKVASVKVFPWWPKSQKVRRVLGLFGVFLGVFSTWMMGVLMGAGMWNWETMAGTGIWIALAAGLCLQMPTRAIKDVKE